MLALFGEELLINCSGYEMWTTQVQKSDKEKDLESAYDSKIAVKSWANYLPCVSVCSSLT